MKGNEVKTAYIYFRFEAKQKVRKRREKKNTETEKKYGSKSKRKEKYQRETKRKEKYRREIKQSRSIWEAKRCEKKEGNIRLNMQNGSKTNPVLPRFALKRKKFEAKSAHPIRLFRKNVKSKRSESCFDSFRFDAKR